MSVNKDNMNEIELKELSNCIRFLSIDAINKAASGHPGMPMGMSDFSTVLFTEFLKFNPKDPKWIDRDRFILSAGHGSMLLYSLLYLTGYEDITIEDIKKFRQIKSKCAGHPEYKYLQGIETTTGPLGQGIANAVGMALSEKLLKEKLGKDIINHKIYCIAGDGCLMEGISQEAISFAGNLNLNNIVLIWDNNSISIDGDTSLATCEDMKMRFEACGWEVIKINGHNFEEIRSALEKSQNATKPILIDCKTTIAYGSPNKAGSEKSHGSPLGAEETKFTRENLKWEYTEFEIPSKFMDLWRNSAKRNSETYNNWQKKFNSLDKEKSKILEQIEIKLAEKSFQDSLKQLKDKIFNEKATIATRSSSNMVLEFLTNQLDNLIGGSADLTSSVLTKTSTTKVINKDNYCGRYIHYGVREHAMGAIMNGIALHGNLIPYGGTFLVFSDYMKPAIRLASLMHIQVIYIFTHDSIGLGEDGPTHQPIEHLAMLRSIPNLNLFRPADNLETIKAFEIALKDKYTPSVLVLSRQNLPFISPKIDNDFEKGAYILSNSKISKEKNRLEKEITILATGSECSLALDVQSELEKLSISSEVVSMFNSNIFDAQTDEYKNKILDKNKYIISIEASSSFGWHKYTNSLNFSIDSFGLSGKANDLFDYFGLTKEKISSKISKELK